MNLTAFGRISVRIDRKQTNRAGFCLFSVRIGMLEARGWFEERSGRGPAGSGANPPPERGTEGVGKPVSASTRKGLLR